MFRVLHEGKTVLEIEEQVLAASLRTSRGSGKPVFLSSDDGVIELVIEKAAPGGPMRLDQLEQKQIRDIQDRSTEGEVVGTVPDTLNGPEARIMRTPQGTITDTVGSGIFRDPVGLNAFPTEDLGKDADSVEERNRRISEFDNKGSEPEQKASDPEPKKSDSSTPITV